MEWLNVLRHLGVKVCGEQDQQRLSQSSRMSTAILCSCGTGSVGYAVLSSLGVFKLSEDRVNWDAQLRMGYRRELALCCGNSHSTPLRSAVSCSWSWPLTHWIVCKEMLNLWWFFLHTSKISLRFLSAGILYLFCEQIIIINWLMKWSIYVFSYVRHKQFSVYEQP